MHRLPNLFGLPFRFLAISLSLLLVQLTTQPAWSATLQPQLDTANCSGADCRVEFSFSGKTASWTVPKGTGNFRIEIAGASGGGELGGAGALIRANLKVRPGQTIELRLGGAGKRGDKAAGGFNGGGMSGSGMSSAGSGGGMSQLFLQAEADSPILIAGGGGGAGGGSAVSGGASELQGLPGGNGRNSTGGGGGQSARGGEAGQSGDVLVEATAGQAGQGGAGATIHLAAAGGGGGAGYFGGGGGGAAYNGCCHPGSGGGGGSSYFDSRYLSDVQVVSAPQGSGYAVIHYQLLPVVNSHTWQQTSAAAGELQLVFSLPVSAVRLDRIAVSGCARVSAIPLGNLPAKIWNLKLEDCAGSQLRLVIGANSLESPGASGEPILGPDSEHRIKLGFTSTAATLRFQGPTLLKATRGTILLVSDRPITGLESSDLRVTGCSSVASKRVTNGFEVSLSNCADGEQTLRLNASSVRDELGNAAPRDDLIFRFRVDLLPPQATLRLLELDRTAGVAEVEFALSEPVNSPLISLDRQLAAADCEADWTETANQRYLGKVSCRSPLTLTLAANSLVDSAGRTGPTSPLSLLLQFESNRPTASSSLAAIPPWIAVGSPPSDSSQPPSGPVIPSSSPAATAESFAWLAPDSVLFRNLGIAILVPIALILALATIRMRRADREPPDRKSAKNNGSTAVDKYPVFGKPAHRLG